MKTELTLLSFIIMGVILTGCATYAPLLDAAYVSNKHTLVIPEKGVRIKNVESECVTSGKQGRGLMEEAIENALARAPGATYLKDPQFKIRRNGWQPGCVVVTGIAYEQEE